MPDLGSYYMLLSIRMRERMGLRPPIACGQARSILMDRNYFDLKGQVAIVTGCSTGLGVQMAKALASQGANIVAVARRQNLIEEVAQEIASEFGVETLAVRCDITDTDMVNSMVDTVLDKFGRVDILVNNAGTGAVAPAEDITDEQFDNEMQIDLFGSFKVARAVAKKAMIPAKYGRIINIASMYGLVGNKVAGSAPYHAAKGGVVNLTRALAAEWGKYGITVNSICPGYFYTPLTQETLDSDFFQQNAKTMIPEERYGNPGELDTAAIFLSSPCSSYVNGVPVPVDGGYTCM
jgi:gluconate 5-dehydrogenase